MSKMAAIDVAVRMQIAADGYVVSMKETLKNEYKNKEAVAKFLLNVSRSMKYDTPPLFFKTSALGNVDALNTPLHELLIYIDENTSSKSDE